MGMLIGIIGLAFVVTCYFARHIIGGFFGLFRVVPVNEAHIRILNNKKEIFSSRKGGSERSSYWYIPFITKLHKLPLCNLSVPVSDIKLNDKDMAKFVCDIACFVNIDNIDLAVERLSLTDARSELGFDFTKLSEDLKAIMESIGRTVTTKQTILDIYMDRQMLDEAITAEVQAVFPRWGIKLVDLELKDIKDAPNSSIIADIEAKIAADIKRDAEIRIANTNREAEVAKAEAKEAYRKRQIEADRTIGIEEQEQKKQIALREAEANETKVEAQRKLEVGQAEIEKEKVEQGAMAQKLKQQLEAEGKATAIKDVGDADAHVIKVKKVADAEGTEKLAEALKLFNEVAVDVKMIDVQENVLIEKYKAIAQALSNANIDWVLSGENAQDFFGLNLNGLGGANLRQFLSESGITKETLQKLIQGAKEVTTSPAKKNRV